MDITSWGYKERAAVVDAVFDDPHAFTVEDVEWAAEAFGTTEEDNREMFKTAAQLAVLFINESAVYLFMADDRGYLSTASAAGLDGKYWTMTKELIRFSRSAEGIAFCAGTTGFIEDSDLKNGTVRAQWAMALGFVPYAQAEFQGQTFHLCKFGDR